MARKNQRVAHEPYVAPPIVVKKALDREQWISDGARNDAVRRGEDRADERLRRQELARIQQRIDWSVCLIVGCTGSVAISTYWDGSEKADADRDMDRELPLCIEHLTVAWSQMQRHRGHPAVIESAATLDARQRAKAAREAREAEERRKASHAGDIYYLRQNGLIKVGWSSDLTARLRAYGPNVELLCHHPGSRTEETHLHRNLRADLVRGREWYRSDGPVITMFLEQALAKYGAPSGWAQYEWTEPRADIIRQRRHR